VRARRLRWTGFAGTLLLAGGGWLAGARPGPAPASVAEALWGDSGWFRLGLLACLTGLGLLAWAWWRLGGVLRAAPQPPGLRWLLATGALWAVPLLLAPPLGSRDLYAYACQGAVWLDGHDPYAVGAAAGDCRWLASVPSLWQDNPAPYGPLALLGSAAAVAVARQVAGGETGELLVALAGLRLVALAGALLVAAALPRLAAAGGVPAAPATWLGLVTPLVAVHAIAGGHNDALVAGLVVAALAGAAGAGAVGVGAVSADRAGVGGRRAAAWAALAGLAVGLAVAVKVTALAALPFALLLAARRRPGAGVVLGGAAVTAFLGLTLLTDLGVGWTRALLATGALAQWSSVPTGLGMAAGYLLWGLGAPGAFDGAVAVARGVGLVALAGFSAVMLWQAWRRRSDPPAVLVRAGAVLAAVVLLGPVVYPWYALAPLAVLAAVTRDRRARWWLAVATLLASALTLPSGLGVPVLTKFPGSLLLAGLVVGLSWWWLRRRAVAAAGGPAGPTGAAAPAAPAAAGRAAAGPAGPTAGEAPEPDPAPPAPDPPGGPPSPAR
jgi:hypothetical protein